MTADVSTTGDPGESHTVTVQIGSDVEPLKLALPAGEFPAEAILPSLQAIADAVVARAISAAEASGQTISCRAGCAACCRYMPLISDVEARALADLVGRIPEPRRGVLRARFAAARQRMAQAGLFAPTHDDAGLSPERLLALARAYATSAITCPFLEDELCSIYADRPLVCRRMVVTSPAAFCAEPQGNRVQMLRVPMLAAAVLLLTSEEDPPQPAVVPLPLALQWAEAQDSATPRRGADEWMRRFVHRLAETRG